MTYTKQVEKTLSTLALKTVVFVILLGAFACSNNTSNDSSGKKDQAPLSTTVVNTNLNISLLLDLSDRISIEKHPNQTMEYYQRDLGYISAVANAFTKHVRKKKIQRVNDQLQVYFDPAPSDKSINQLSSELKVSLNRKNITKDLVLGIPALYEKNTTKIYDLAIKDNNFIGSDIWGFFKKNVRDYCLKDEMRNILIILTDGYIFHENSSFAEDNHTTYVTYPLIKRLGLATRKWQEKMDQDSISLIKANNNLQDLEVLVIGVNPEGNNPYEADIINKYWSDWFNSMGITSFKIREAELPSNLEGLINDFILKKAE